MQKNLQSLGFDQWHAAHCDPQKQTRFEVARVIAAHKEGYLLSDGRLEIQAQVIGRLLYAASSPLDFPTVGDWVLACYHDQNHLALIHEILPRRSLLKRKTVGKKVDVQLMGANIDRAMIMQSLDGDFNLRRLERYQVVAADANMGTAVLLSKSDLIPADEIQDKIGAVKRLLPESPVLALSSFDGSGLTSVGRLLVAGKTYCLLGSSGVGKTTFLNHLAGQALFATQKVRAKDGKGRHTTTHRHLIRLAGGAMIIDTPGMRELGIMSTSSAIEQTFADISSLSERCRFNDCTHVNEQGCAVLEALHSKSLTEQRYRNFIKMSKEAAFNQSSYAEKRRKDRQFGKMCKAVMQSKVNRR